MQTDPIGYGGGLNWYNYVGSDPINATDPSGLDKEFGFIRIKHDGGVSEKQRDIVVTALRDGGVSGRQRDIVVTAVRAGNSAALSNAPAAGVGRPMAETGGDASPQILENRTRDRGRTARPDGTQNPNKKIRPHPTRPGWVIDNSKKDGKGIERPARLGEPGYNGPPANFTPLDPNGADVPFQQPPSTVAPAAGLGLGVIIIGGIIILLSPVGL